MAILTIARLTLVEASRRRLLIALGALTLIVIAGIGWGFSKVPTLGGPNTTASDITQIEAIMEILACFMFSFLLAFASVFVAAPAIASDIESGVILAIVPRPLRRSEIVLGRWLGLSGLVALYTVTALLVEMEVVNLVVGYVPSNPLAVIGFLTLEGVVAITMGLLFSTRLAPMTGGIVATILLLVVWFAGIVGNIGVAFDNSNVAAIGSVSRLILPTDGIWRGALYYLQSEQLLALQRLAGRRAAGNPFFAPSPPPWTYLAWIGAWILGLLGLSTLSFRTREL
ncbi:MAG: ABC transporter permease [Chloroflexi bacterium]|nr:MAG: ABC transporter permease [Chloroflexota bacterium]